MEQNILDQGMMLRYLLGLLSEEERARVEESFFQDDACFEELSVLEDDLIDDYARGLLSPDTRKAFEEKLRSNPLWRQRVTFAQALSRRIGEQASRAHAGPPASISLFQMLIDIFRNQRPIFKVAVAAASLIVLVGVVSLAWQVFQQRTTLQTAQAERQNLQATVDALKRQAAGLEKQGQDLSRQLDEERLKLQDLENKRPTNGTVLGLVASFVLRAGVVRGNDSVMRITVPPAARTVRLQLELNPGDDYPAYRAEVRTAKGTAVATRDMVRSPAAGAGKAVILELPAQSLPAGQYEIGLLGRVEPGKFEQIAYYYFDVD